MCRGRSQCEALLSFLFLFFFPPSIPAFRYFERLTVLLELYTDLGGLGGGDHLAGFPGDADEIVSYVLQLFDGERHGLGVGCVMEVQISSRLFQHSSSRGLLVESLR